MEESMADAGRCGDGRGNPFKIYINEWQEKELALLGNIWNSFELISTEDEARRKHIGEGSLLRILGGFSLVISSFPNAIVAIRPIGNM